MNFFNRFKGKGVSSVSYENERHLLANGTVEESAMVLEKIAKDAKNGNLMAFKAIAPSLMELPQDKWNYIKTRESLKEILGAILDVNPKLLTEKIDDKHILAEVFIGTTAEEDLWRYIKEKNNFNVLQNKSFFSQLIARGSETVLKDMLSLSKNNKILELMKSEAETETRVDPIQRLLLSLCNGSMHFMNLLLADRPNLIPAVMNYVKNSGHPELLKLQIVKIEDTHFYINLNQEEETSAAEQIFEMGDAQSVKELLDYLYANNRPLLHSILPRITYKLAHKKNEELTYKDMLDHKALDYKLSKESEREREILEKLFDVVLKDENPDAVLTLEYRDETVAESLICAANRLNYTEPIIELIRRANGAFWAVHKGVTALGEAATPDMRKALQQRVREPLGNLLRE